MLFTSSKHCSQCIFGTFKQLKIKNKEKQKFQKGTLGRNCEVHLVEPHYENRCKMIAKKDMDFFFGNRSQIHLLILGALLHKSYLTDRKLSLNKVT